MAVEVLVVEDSRSQALRLELVLNRAGFAVTIAQTGSAAIREAKRRPLAAVVLDVNLPDVDGFQVCRTLKDSPATARLPVIMLTVRDQARETLDGLDAGADAYIPKDGFAEANLLDAMQDLGLIDLKGGGVE